MERTVHIACVDERIEDASASSRSDTPSRCRTINDLPGPKGLPLVGNMLQLDLKRLHVILEQWANTYGPVYKFRIANKTMLAVADPDLINEVLRKRPAAYRRFSSIEPVLKEMGINGVFSAEGAHWARQRQVAMQALNTAHLRQFFSTLTTVTARLKQRWDKTADGKTQIEVQKDLTRYTVDVTSHLAFGYDVNTLEKDGDVIQQHLEKIFPMINRRINAPFPYWYFFKFPADRALDVALDAVRKAIVKFIAHSRAQLATNPDLLIHPTNFLEAMLAAHDVGDAEFTDDEIAGNVMTMLLGGEDSTASILAWMVHFMADYPEVQKRMQQEADEVLGDARMLHDFRNHDRLSYIEAVAYETMRLKPVFPVLFLGTNQAVELGGTYIPAGTAIFLLTRQCGLQENAFSDSCQFQPERWLVSQAASQRNHNPKAFVPFGAGPRFCPGRNLALLEIKAVMAMLCRNFSIAKAANAKPVAEHFAFFMMPTNLSVYFRARERSHGPDRDPQLQVVQKCPFASMVS